MPVKRRQAKRRVNAEREYEIWESILTCGVDFFDELPELGLTAEGGMRSPPMAEARAAWAAYGARILLERKPGDKEPWALLEFGRP